MSQMVEIKVSEISPNPRNPRKEFKEEAMNELIKSIKNVGLLQPVIVVADGEKYRLVAGERRWRAAQGAELETIPALVKELTPEQELEAMVTENLQREDISPIEEAEGFKMMLDDLNYTQEQLAEKLGCSQAHIANRIRLLKLPEEIQEKISRKIITSGHGVQLVKIKDYPEIINSCIKEIEEESLPVSQTKDLILRQITASGKPLHKEHWEYMLRPVFDMQNCDKCEHNHKGSYFYDNETKPYCLNTNCWDEKQTAALKQLELEREQQDDDTGQTEEERERARAKAAETRAENEKKKAEIQKEIESIVSIVEPPVTEELDPCITQIIDMSHQIWYEESNKGYRMDEQSVSLDHESIITLDGLFKYWQTRDKICQEATSLPGQLGHTAIIIKEQGIYFKGPEITEYANDGTKTSYNIKIEDGKLLLANSNGTVVDEIPELPIYYRIRSYQYAGSKIITQMVGIKTPSRIIVMYGSENAMMRKDVFTHWIDLVGELPGIHCYTANNTKKESPTLETVKETEPTTDKAYLNTKGKKIFVKCLNDKYGTFWQSEHGGLHRIVTPEMPMVDNFEEAQINLDKWAEKKGLEMAV